MGFREDVQDITGICKCGLTLHILLKNVRGPTSDPQEL
jgi:hypothetical protein